ncbi:DUF6363 domain-containing protein [Anaeromicrobium sediminis]|uniref:DUF6363 domain-containing protein n=1 Tax=Anaeromicrobium sediminis TaxID=1478221 RepID=A0A267MQA3_9FIRM|nr:DUF6363 domain-containing protein [Anaeromicrobium sediminis]PAB61085.1 hypothetical protein CCE28_01260 [Anaeromicrobium sediminis]
MDGSKYNTLLDNLKASSSLPFISKPYIISNVPHLDGGLTDPISFKRALELGYEKIVVILTQPSSYVKELLKLPGFLQSKYKKYPKILKALKNRHDLYNKQRDDLFQLYEEGKAFIIMPPTKIPAKRIDKNLKRLHRAYDSGYEYICAHGDALKRFLKL